MQKLKKVIVPFGFCFMFFFFTVALFTVWNAGERKAEYVLELHTAVSDKICEDAVLTPGEKSLKTKKMWVKIIATYGIKNFERAMNKYVLADFVNKGVRWTLLLDLPEFGIPAYGILESGFDKYCEGRIGEKGMFQHHETALPVMQWYLRQMYLMLPEVAKEIDPQVLEQKELIDPIKSLKVQLILMWGMRRQFPDELYWVSAVHWGDHKVKPWFLGRTEPKEYFVFYSKERLEKVDKRSPLMYYFYWKKIITNFERYNLEFGKTLLSEYDTYRDECSKAEKEYINSRDLIARLIKQAAQLEEKAKEFDEGIADVSAYKKKIETLDAAFGKIYGEEKKRGQYDNMYARTKALIKDCFPVKTK